MSRLRIVALGCCLATTGCEGWAEPQLIDSVPAAASSFWYFNPKIASGGGAATAVYTHRFENLKASRRVPPWTAPELVGEHAARRHGHAVAIGGDAITTTLFSNRDGTDLMWSRFASGLWSTPVSMGEAGFRPSLAADGAGNVLALWENADTVRAARWVAGSGWEATVSLNRGALDVRSLGVATNPSGVGVAAWCERRVGGSHIVAHRFEPSSGWSIGEVLARVPACDGAAPSFPDLDDHTTVVVGIDDAGVPTALWTDGDIKLRRQTLSPSPVWALPVTLTGAGEAINPRLAVNAANDALAVWQTAGLGRNMVQGSRFSSTAAGWSSISTLAPPISTPRPPDLAVGIDDAGRGMVAFIEGGAATVVRHDGSAFLAARTLGRIGDYELDLDVTRGGTAYLVRANSQRDVLIHQYTP